MTHGIREKASKKLLPGPIWVAAMTVGMLVLTSALPVSADTGDDCQDSGGINWEEPECGMSCSEGDFIQVHASQQDMDDSVYTEGDALCATAHAECAEDLSDCVGTSTSTASEDSGEGICKGKMYSTYLTDAHIYCYSGNEDAINAIGDLTAGTESQFMSTFCGSSLYQVLAQLYGVTSIAYIHLNYDGSTLTGAGKVWRSGEACKDQAPDCATVVDGYTTLYYECTLD